MRAWLLVAAGIVSCTSQETPAPRVHLPVPPEDAGPPALPPVLDRSADWDVTDQGAPELRSMNDDGIPSLLADATGVTFAMHRMVVAACMKCTADRRVRRWDGAAWTGILSENGWPGSGSQSTALAPGPAGTFFADSDLSDPYHPPLRVHLWTLDAGQRTEPLPPLGSGEQASNPALAVDAAGAPTVAWPRAATPRPAPRCAAGEVAVARWDDAARAWRSLPMLSSVPERYGTCSLSMLADGDAVLVAHTSSFLGQISVDRWDGQAWSSLGATLGSGLPALARSPRGTPLVITSLGVLEWTDQWRIAAPASDFVPVAIASGRAEVWSWWAEDATLAHPAQGQLRRMTLK